MINFTQTKILNSNKTVLFITHFQHRLVTNQPKIKKKSFKKKIKKARK